MTYLERITEIYTMLGEGRALQAFDKYYHDDVVMIEATGEVRKGKVVNRAFEEQFFSGIREVHGGGPTAICSNEEKAQTMVESWMDITFMDGNRVKMEEVAVQQWEGDKIVRERFYYNMPG
ncbi:MAG: hypothetical protein Kow00127_20110 [Bacteroidales bacterium]